jgi:hypothetical protein
MCRSAVRGKRERCRDPQALERLDVAAANVDVLAHAHEPIGMLRQRGDELHALPRRKGARRRKRRTAEEMDGTVAQALRAVLGAILRDELDIDALLFEEAEFHGSGRHEIRRRVVVRHYHSIHVQSF